MKELSIEEKAKAYDEALARANEMIKDMMNIGGVAKVDDIQYLFPELKESEGEKIRKALIDWFGDTHAADDFGGIAWERIVAWLEKQGEQPKKHDVCDYCDQQGSCVSPCPMKLVEKQGEQKPADGTFVNVDDVREDFVQEVYRVLDADSTNDRANQIIDAFDNLPTVTIEVLNGEKVDNANKVEQKPAWSEEDLYKIKHALFGTYAVDTATRLLNKIKSFKLQNTWKPSDEQIKALETALYTNMPRNDERYSVLSKFVAELKKLREE